MLPRLWRRGLRAGGRVLRPGRPGNPRRGGGAQVAPPTQGKGQVAEAASANGLRVGAWVGGARPGAPRLQPRVEAGGG